MKFTSLFVLLLTLLCLCSPGLCQKSKLPTSFPATAVVVNPNPKDRLNLREKPDKSSNSQGKFYNSVEVSVLSIEDDWAEVSVGKGVMKGYMLAEFLKFDLKKNPVESATPQITITDPNGKRVFKRKEANAAELKRLESGTQATVLAVTQDDWLLIHTGKTYGFIKNSGVSPTVSFSNQTAETRTASSYASVREETPLYKNENQSAVLRTLAYGELVTVLQFDSQLSRVTDGKNTGYVSSLALNYNCGEWTLPAQESSAVVSCQANERLHLRAKPSTSAKSLGKYYAGSRVIITGKKTDGFFPVKAGTLEGYMMADYLTLSGLSAYDSVISGMPILCVTTPSGKLHLRQSPNTSSKSLGLYASGKLVTLCGQSDEWAHVIVDGQLGFMMLKFLSDPPL